MHMEKYQAHALTGVLRHNARVWESRGYERDNIDNALIGDNYNLAPDRGDAAAWVSERIAALDLKRAPRKDAVRVVEWVATLPEGETDGRAFFESTAKHMTEIYGADNVVGAWVHLDEPNARPHMHFDFVPVTEDGRLSAKAVMSRAHLRRMHPMMQRAVSADLGHEVPFLLPEEERGRRELSRLDAANWRAAVDESKRAQEDARRAAERARAAEDDARVAEGELAAVGSELVDTRAELGRCRAEADEHAARAAEMVREVERKTAEGAELDARIERKKTELDAVMGATRQQAQALAEMRHEAETESRRADAARRRAADAQAEIDASVRRKGEALAAEREAAERLESVRRDVEEVEGIALAGVFELGKLAAGGDDGARERAAESENRQLRSRLAALEGERGGLGAREQAARSRACELDEGVRRAGSRRDCIAERLRGLRERADRLWAQLLDAADHFVGSIFTDVGRLKWVFDGLGIESHEGNGYDAMPDPGIAPPRRSEPQQQRSHHRRR